MKVADDKLIVLNGFKTRFGGELTTGFCCIYKDMNALKYAESETK